MSIEQDLKELIDKFRFVGEEDESRALENLRTSVEIILALPINFKEENTYVVDLSAKEASFLYWEYLLRAIKNAQTSLPIPKTVSVSKTYAVTILIFRPNDEFIITQTDKVLTLNEIKSNFEAIQFVMNEPLKGILERIEESDIGIPFHDKATFTKKTFRFFITRLT